MGLALLLVLWAESAVDLELMTPKPLPIVKDMIRDWEAVPFVSMTISTSNCTDGAEEVFVRAWNGTERGCKPIEDKPDLRAAPRDTWKEQGNKLADCVEVKAISAVDQGAVMDSGARICGRRGGKPFESVSRPDAATGKCPEG